MVKFERPDGRTIRVSFGEKTLDFSLDRLPADWETLLRDPDVAGCVNEVVLRRGVAAGGGAVPAVGWDEVRLCIEKADGSTG